MRIDILLPYREKFTLTKASAVSTSVKNSITYSSYRNEIKIYGHFVENPMLQKNFIGIKTYRLIHFSNNISLIKNYLKLNQNNNEKKLIEIHNRPYLLKYLLQKTNHNPIILYFHNDPLKMKGSISIKEREGILKNTSGLVFVSEFLKEKFLKGINTQSSKLFVIPNSLDINKNASLDKKRKQILFVGRLVSEKGVQIYVNAIKKIAKKFSDWEFLLIGNSGKRKKFFQKNNFETKIIRQFKDIGPNTKHLGFISNEKVLSIMEDSQILVVPSIWEEPFGLTAIEGLSNRMLVIANNVGGLKDIISNRGVLLDDINEEILSKKLAELLNNPKQISTIQNKCLENYIYDQATVSFQQDVIRKNIFQKYFNAK
tara:strand:+ start:1117 stop:2229 length:1113 start_codon:yes stop_codon:yes gene_type:complete